ncbi:MAG: GNAT family N-acetyltransferase [Trueperaceae bacterium]|nr:GNAT family N-acetyltransferase [Trueperaceae bacterium]
MSEQAAKGPDDAVLRHNEAYKRFEAQLGSETAVASYMRVRDTYIFTHTEVPDAFEGRGIGSRLVRYALEHVKAEGRSVAPLCPFVKGYIERHPEYKSLVKMGM